MIHGLAVFFGLNDGTGHGYLFWSGVGSDVGELAIIGGLVSIARRHNCHARRCWRIGRHPVDGTPYMTCHRHHPALTGRRSPTAADIADMAL